MTRRVLARLRNWWTMRGLRHALERCRCRLCLTCDLHGSDVAQYGHKPLWLCRACKDDLLTRPYPIPLTGAFR